MSEKERYKVSKTTPSKKDAFRRKHEKKSVGNPIAELKLLLLGQVCGVSGLYSVYKKTLVILVYGTVGDILFT